MVGVLVYSNSLSVPFHYDDILFIKENLQIKSLSLFGAWISGSWVSIFTGRAFLMFTFLLNYILGGFDTFGYHLLNLLIHTGSAFILYLFLFRYAESDRDKGYSPAGLLAALLFLIHPIATESVTYIWSRSSLLATFCILASLLCFFRATGKKLHAWWYIGSLLLFFLGLSTKETTVVLPALLLLSDFLLITKDRSRFPARLKYHFPFLLIIGLLVTLYLPYVSRPEAARPWSTHIYTEIRVLVEYLRLLIAPVGLTIDHQVMPIMHMDRRVIFSLLLFILLLAGGVYLRYKKPLISFSIFWFFINMAPFLAIRLNDFMVERWVYTASIGFSILLAELLMLAVSRYRRMGIALIVALVAAGCFITIMRNQLYVSHIALWEDAARKTPENYRPYSVLSRAYRENGNPARAIEAALESIRLAKADNKVEVKAHINLAAAYADLGEFQKAEDALKSIESYAAGHFEFHNNRGVLAMKRKDYEKAIQSFLRAAEIKPGSPTLMYLLGLCYEKLDRKKESEHYYLLATQSIPQTGPEFINQGTAFSKRGDTQRAIASFFKAVQADPDDVTIRVNLANFLRSSGYKDDAFRHYATASKMSPNFVPARIGMGLVLLDQRKFDEAKAQFEKVLDLLPPDSPDRKEVQELIDRCHA